MVYQINNPETLTVTRDDEIDQDYYDAIYAAKRRQALHTAARQAITFVTEPIKYVIETPAVVGRNVLDLLHIQS